MLLRGSDPKPLRRLLTYEASAQRDGLLGAGIFPSRPGPEQPLQSDQYTLGLDVKAAGQAPGGRGREAIFLDDSGRWRSELELRVTVQLQEIVDVSRILNAAVLCQGLSRGAKSMEKIILLWLALLWQIYSCRRSLQIHFRQCGHRRGGSRAKSSRMAWRTAGKVG